MSFIAKKLITALEKHKNNFSSGGYQEHQFGIEQEGEDYLLSCYINRFSKKQLKSIHISNVNKTKNRHWPSSDSLQSLCLSSMNGIIKNFQIAHWSIGI